MNFRNKKNRVQFIRFNLRLNAGIGAVKISLLSYWQAGSRDSRNPLYDSALCNPWAGLQKGLNQRSRRASERLRKLLYYWLTRITAMSISVHLSLWLRWFKNYSHTEEQIKNILEIFLRRDCKSRELFRS